MPACEELGFPGIGMDFSYGETIMTQLDSTLTVPAESPRELPLGKDWEFPVKLIFQWGDETWQDVGEPGSQLIVWGPHRVTQGALDKKTQPLEKEKF